MKKQVKHFEVKINMLNGATPCGELTVCGVGYFWPQETPEDQIDYDVDQVFFEDKDVLPVLKWQYGSVKEIDELHEAVMSHLEGYFRPDTVTVVNRVQAPEPTFPDLPAALNVALAPFFKVKTA